MSKHSRPRVASVVAPLPRCIAPGCVSNLGMVALMRLPLDSPSSPGYKGVSSTNPNQQYTRTMTMPTTKEASSNGTNLNVLNRHWSEHHRQLTADARQWVQQAATAAVHADSTDPWTTAAVMAALDMRHDAPMSYSRQTPQHRYTMVRYALANAASEGHLGAQPTVNSRGRDSVGYVAPAAADPLPWRVEVTGGPRAANVVKQLEAWLKANAAVVGDLDGLLILRK